MTDLQLAPVRLDTMIQHAHLWTLYIEDGRELTVVAYCDCGARLTKEQAENILNGHQLEMQVA